MSQSTIRRPLLTASSANRAKVVQSIPSINTLNTTNSSTDNNLPIYQSATTEQLKEIQKYPE